MPAGHSRHAVAPADGWYVPTSQLEQLPEAPTITEAEPVAQPAQAVKSEAPEVVK